MSAILKPTWPMSLNAPADSLEAKQPDVDNGLDVPDPGRYYTPEFMQREWQQMWPRVWLLAGVVSDLPEHGDYSVFEIGAEQILLIRQADHSIKAFYNACPHRGNRIALNERGSVAAVHLLFPWLAVSLQRPAEGGLGRAQLRAGADRASPGPDRGALRDTRRDHLRQHGREGTAAR